MYAGDYAKSNPERPAIIMANSGKVVSYRAFDEQTSQLAHFLRDIGLNRLDHYAIFMENNSDYLICCGAGERSGLYFTCVNSYLKPDELAYIINNSESKVLITSLERLAVAEQSLKHCPAVDYCLVVGMRSSRGQYLPYEQTLAGYPTTPIADEYLGTPMLYSSGTTGRPKGVLRPGGRAAESTLIFGNFFDRDLVVPTRHGVSVAGAVVSLGASDGGRIDYSPGWYLRNYGAL